MADIRYVCLSDTHFGLDTSLLTNLQEHTSDIDSTEASPVAKNLVQCLEALIGKNKGPEKPTLILNGDILDLALVPENHAAMAWLRFIELIFPENGEPLFDKTIYYIPGNHDHHLWESARESRYVDILVDQIKDPKAVFPGAWHTTKLFIEKDCALNNTKPIPIFFLNSLLRMHKHLQDAEVIAAYPNFGLLSGDQRKCVIFHHGHFTEILYSAISRLQTMLFDNRDLPARVYDLEADNFAWIDFLWSTLGRSGDAGRDIKSLYEMALEGEKGLQRPIDNLARAIADEFIHSILPEFSEKWLIKQALGLLLKPIADLDRNVGGPEVGVQPEGCLSWYVNNPLMRQILDELDETMPAEVTFVFGHTHKPFEKKIAFDGALPELVGVYNTGGWVFEKPERRPHIGGAVVLVDENLNTVSLRGYDEDGAPVAVAEARAPGETPSDFFEEISARCDSLDSNTGLLIAFSETVNDQIEGRTRRMLDKRKRRESSVIT